MIEIQSCAKKHTVFGSDVLVDRVVVLPTAANTSVIFIDVRHSDMNVAVVQEVLA